MNSLLTTATDATATEETEVVAVPSPKATNATPEKEKVKDKDAAVSAPAAPMASKEIAVTPAPVEESLFEALVVGTAHKTHRVDASTHTRQTVCTRQPISSHDYTPRPHQSIDTRHSTFPISREIPCFIMEWPTRHNVIDARHLIRAISRYISSQSSHSVTSQHT